MLSKELLQQLEQIRQIWARDQVEEAYLRYEGLLQEYPEHPVILREYGRAILAEHGDLEKSATLFERALEREPDSVIALQCLSILYSWGYGRGYPAGMPLYCRLIELAPTNKQICVEAYLGIGMRCHPEFCVIRSKEGKSSFPIEKKTKEEKRYHLRRDVLTVTMYTRRGRIATPPSPAPKACVFISSLIVRLDYFTGIL